MSLTPERIAQIRDFDGSNGLLDFLRDELNWPLELGAELDELSFSFDGNELKLSDSTTDKLAGGEVYELQNMIEEQPWGLFFVRFDDTKLPVSALRDILRSLVRKSAERRAFAPDNLLFVCATKDYKQFRFAHFQERKSAQPLLQTFGWDRGDEHVRTLCEFNLARLQWKDIYGSEPEQWREEWQSAFDVSQVTKNFFNDYEACFRVVESSVAGFEAPAGASDKTKDECEERRNAWTQKLFNRLLFLAFVQKKGWMMPPATATSGSNYLESLWNDYEARKEQLEAASFYTTRLKPLFIAINSRSGGIEEFVGKVPYLNGGLFDTEEDKRKDPKNLAVDDEAIRAVIFDLFAKYNFTVQESTPLDVQVAVDPEMLGKVFEKLILKRDRKAGGSYYTPRTIVTFMCREALKRFLGDKYAPLIERGDVNGISLNEAVALLDKLAKVKIVDPACGSGAYLLGMLHELFVLNKRLDTKANRATARDDYRRKLDIIQNNLYGVDLDNFAVHIARLRLWLSLVVEFDAAGGETPEPLPNLDFKIEVGDSLTAPAPNPQQLALHRQQIIDCQKLKDEYADYHSGGKKEKYDEIVHAREEIADWLKASARGSANSIETAETFDWLVRFGEVFLPSEGTDVTLDGRIGVADKVSRQPALSYEVGETGAGGFDIVLANPPYGSEISDNVRWNFFDRRKDGAQSKEPYGLFIARGLELLREGGALCFIVSNTWRTIKSHKPLRKRLALQTRVEHLLDLPRWVFDATVDTGILTLVKEAPEASHPLIAADLSALNQYDWNGLEANLEAVAAHGPDAQTLDYARYTFPQSLIAIYENHSFFIGSPKLYRLMSDPKFEKLSELAEVKVGLQTGDNDFYIRKRAEVRGSYEILDDSKLLSEKEIAALSDKEKSDGVDPKSYGGRHFVPYDKGGESDAREGWLPNYYVPTGYFIDWSKASVSRLKNATLADVKQRKGELIVANDKTRIASRFQNSQYYFNSGLTYSRTGEYAPTFRMMPPNVFDTKSNGVFPDGISNNALCALMNSRFVRCLFKTTLCHTVQAEGDAMLAVPIPRLN